MSEPSQHQIQAPEPDPDTKPILDTAPPASPQGWEKYFQENTLKVIWSLVMFLGGSLVLVFFWHIEFLPELDLGSSAALLASIALVGLSSILVLGGMFIAPGIFMRSMVSEGILVRFLSKDQAQEQGISEEALWDQKKKILFWPPLIAALVVVGSLFLLTAYFSVVLWSSIGLWVMVMLLALDQQKFQGVVSKKFARCWKRGWGRHRWEHLELQPVHWTFMIITFTLIGTASIQFLVFFRVYQGDYGDIRFSLVLFFWLFWIGIFNVAWGYLAQKGYLLLISGGAFLSLIILLAIGSNPMWVSISAIKILGLGEIEPVQILVNRNGCTLVRSATNGVCVDMPGVDAYSLAPVKIVSRMGSEYLLEVCQNNQRLQVVMSRDDVIGWSRLPKAVSPATQKESAAAKNQDDSHKEENKTKKRVEEESDCVSTIGQSAIPVAPEGHKE